MNWTGQVGKVNMTNQSGCLPRYEDMTETRGKYGERRERTHLGTTCPIIRNGPLEQSHISSSLNI